ncbi:TetR/AcrR family transcriptional regulator [Micromonospora ureilytica]|uniref:TetR/AcrR family transcriptional regulator n=1 Tax=Micromonospora ureilytica TaxID=709868 RepID=UPI0033E6C761
MSEHSGAGNPATILRLLWRHQRVSTEALRGRRPRLSIDRVIETAVALADAGGLAAASIHHVAKALGVGSMTLYTYVPSKAELLDLMVDAIMAERDLPLAGDPAPEGWRARVDLYVDRTRAMLRRHPWAPQVSMTRPPLGPGTMAAREYLVATFADTSLSPRQINAVAQAVGAFVDGAAAMEVRELEVERLTGQSQEVWWHERQVFWDEYFDVERYPAIARLWHAGGYDDPQPPGAEQGPYAFGLDRMLVGIDQLITLSRQPAPER